MLTDFISITDLQKNMKATLASRKQPIRIIMSKNKVTGLIISKEATELLMKSDVLTQLREELWELNDPETRDLMIRHQKGLTNPVPFDSFAKEYGI